jgi:hypothetical protein
MKSSLSMSSCSSKRQEKEKKIIYNARFVKENFGDRHKVGSNQEFTKEWTFRNNGDVAWPADTYFI